jgi:hypothetical protein
LNSADAVSAMSEKMPRPELSGISVTSGTLLIPYSGVSDSADSNQTLLTLFKGSALNKLNIMDIKAINQHFSHTLSNN